VTNEVAGQIRVNADDPSQTQINPIAIQADSLVTDNSFRNGAIRDLILNSGSFPLVTFTPTSIEGLPEQGSVGETYALTITGDLTVRDITQQVTFDGSVTPVSESRLEGSAAATISRSGFELTIPSVPNVADVSDEVILEIDFVAIAS
jgi:polyisoprenoid-binding protein YceI